MFIADIYSSISNSYSQEGLYGIDRLGRIRTNWSSAGHKTFSYENIL